MIFNCERCGEVMDKDMCLDIGITYIMCPTCGAEYEVTVDIECVSQEEEWDEENNE